MRITSSQMNLQSTSLTVKYSSKFEYLRKWDKDSESISSQREENGETITQFSSIKDKVDLSVQNGPDLKNDQSADTDSVKNNPLKDAIDEIWKDLRMKIIKDLVELFSGKKIDILDADEIAQDDTSNNDNAISDLLSSWQLKRGDKELPVSPLPNNAQPALKGWGVDYFYQETHFEKEGFLFNASGNITNDKGEVVQFNASLQMSREKYDQITVSIKEGDALIDPLVVDFTGTGASLSDAVFEFDLNADGRTEMIHVPSRGTAFLAYDKNGNGVIDDGSELFGPSSGNGFAELAALDEDNNGWIDENDSAFKYLRLWEKAADGTDSLSTLLEKDIGALYTGRVETGFNLENNNSVSGVIKETGIYLKESGGAGFIQEIDFVV